MPTTISELISERTGFGIKNVRNLAEVCVKGAK